ncbi:MAG: STAS domain-containing protein, partial [Planctomycetota bacterium]
MSIQKFSEDVIFVDLPFKEPDIGSELQAVNEIITGRDDCDVILDFFRVEIITSSSLSNLIILRRLMLEHGRELILCNVSHVTKYIFIVANLDKIFEFVDDRLAALAAV